MARPAVGDLLALLVGVADDLLLAGLFVLVDLLAALLLEGTDVGGAYCTVIRLPSLLSFTAGLNAPLFLPLGLTGLLTGD